MNQLNEVKIMNDTMILYLKKLGKNCRRNEIIKNILQDETCFFKMNKEDAYIILNDVGIQEEKINDIYSKLVSNDTYYDLYKDGKINENDTELIIKYKIYKADDLFKNKHQNQDFNDNINENIQNSMVVYKENIFIRVINKIKMIFGIK